MCDSNVSEIACSVGEIAQNHTSTLKIVWNRRGAIGIAWNRGILPTDDGGCNGNGKTWSELNEYLLTNTLPIASINIPP